MNLPPLGPSSAIVQLRLCKRLRRGEALRDTHRERMHAAKGRKGRTANVPHLLNVEVLEAGVEGSSVRKPAEQLRG